MKLMNGIRMAALSLLGTVILVSGTAVPAAENKLQIHTIESEYQPGKQAIQVLMPDDYSKKKTYRVLYVLPVEEGLESKFGKPLEIIRAMDAHNKYRLICVYMGFASPPWFGDHPTNKDARQASHLVKAVVPFIEERYSVGKMVEDRLLFGFSKSGWGVAALLMKYPDVFGYAGTWDVPWCMEGLVWGLRENFGTQEAMNEWRPDLLAPTVAKTFSKQTRLVVAGENAWGLMRPLAGGDKSRTHTAAFHEILEACGFKHVYRNDLKVKHRWDRKWMEPVLTELMKIAREKPQKDEER